MRCSRVVKFLLIICSVALGVRSDFRACEDCGGGVSTGRQTLLTSPNYPEAYPPMTCCRYLIRSVLQCPTEYHVQFLDFSLERSEDCANDFLAVGADSAGDTATLCGHVIGARRFRSPDGALRLRFVTNNDVEEWGFRLLITRQPCEETPMTSNITSENGVDIQTPVVTRPGAVAFTKEANNHQQAVLRSVQYLPQAYLPLPPTQPPCQENNYSPQDVNYPQLPPPYVTGACCASNFRQARFYLTSPGLPARTDGSRPRDCFYYIEKSRPDVCRLRVVFRFFALGVTDAQSGECLSDFIEIDGERMCGCRTGSVYTSAWGLGTKAIRVKTNGRLSGTPSVGFLLDVSQESCAVARFARQAPNGFAALPHAIVETNTTMRTGIYLRGQHGFGVTSELVPAQRDPCEFGFADLLALSFDPLWVTRSTC